MDNKIKRAYDSVRISEDNKQRVLEALLAEERKEKVITMTSSDKRTVRKTARHSAGFIAAIVAAAVMTVSAGAYAYNKLSHKEGVAEYIGKETADMIEEQGKAIDQSVENEHIRMTLDTVISTGNIAEIYMTAEALDDEGRQLLDKKCPKVRFRFADSDETLFIEQMEMTEEPENDCYTFVTYLFSGDIDLSRTMVLDFIDPNADFTDVNCNEVPEEFFRGFEGMSFEADLSQNYDVTELHSEDGGLVRLSRAGVEVIHESGVYAPDRKEYTEDEMTCVYLIRNDGTREKALIYTEFDGIEEGICISVYHGAIADPGEYSGVEAYGVLYTR